MKVYIRTTLAGEFVSAHTSLESAQDTIPGAKWLHIKDNGGRWWWTNTDLNTPAGWIDEHEVIE